MPDLIAPSKRETIHRIISLASELRHYTTTTSSYITAFEVLSLFPTNTLYLVLLELSAEKEELLCAPTRAANN